MTPNLAAFLSVIRHCEGTAGPDGYRTLFGGDLFDGYADHPRIVVERSGYKSSAAGAYQILQGTWDDFIRANGPHDFSPSSQDLCARWLIGRRGATADVEAGRLEEAIAKCNREWASLPGSPYGQPTRTLDYCRRVYREAGGLPDMAGQEKAPATAAATATATAITAPATATATQPTRKAMDPLSLVSMLASVFTPMLRAKVEKSLGTEVGKPLVDNLLAATMQITGKTDPLEAVAVARQQPETVKALETKAEDWFAAMQPALDKIAAYESAAWAAEESSRDAAARRGQQMAEVGVWKSPQFWIASFILANVTGVVFTVLYRDTFSSDMQSFVIGAIVGGALTAVISYFFGSSRGSAAKDIVIGELAERGKQ